MDNSKEPNQNKAVSNLQSSGKIVGVQGQVVEVEFASGGLPAIRDVLVLEGDAQARMEVLKSSGQNSFYCILFSESANLSRGQKVINTHQQISIPVGSPVLSRVVNIFGESLDGGAE